MRVSKTKRSQISGSSTNAKKGADIANPSWMAMQQHIGNRGVLQLMSGVKRKRNDDEIEIEEEEEEQVSRPTKKKKMAETESESEETEMEEEEEKEKRPGFTAGSKRAAFISHNLKEDANALIKNYKSPGLTEVNGAMPHRMSYKDIRDNTHKFTNGQETAADFTRWTDRFVQAGNEKIALRKGQLNSDPGSADLKQLIKDMEKSQKAFEAARDKLAGSPGDKSALKSFIKQANSFHANVPDVGPHFGVNNPVQDNAHMHVETVESKEEPMNMESPSSEMEIEENSDEKQPPKLKRRLSIMSRQVRRMSVGRISAFPYDSTGKLITTDGSTVDLDELPEEDSEAIEKHPKRTVKGYDPDFDFGL
ncbi:hypothetical protein [Paenibacillus sp. NEAU-GSW1]|uniref:hypothetical protein n=1 Tax=Paenibacillus sp. NEAU-GSW1 TaxID=2682486 RepID=UPI0012E0DE82|nr:hypothetical protein [Paenibacillus sp. NEAU-GSW1]MUT65176.1 hypothetical protein [Paenibacillus sp. NEAU-GSW1]